MPDIIDHYTSRPARYAHLDGTGDLTLGIWLLVFAVLTRFGTGYVGWRWFLVTYGVIGVVGAALHYGTLSVRKRLTYRRSGYVVPRKQPWVYPALLAFVVAAALVLFWAQPHLRAWSPPLVSGAVVGLAFLIGGLRTRMRRFTGYAVYSLGAGGMAHLLDPTLQGTVWYWLLMAAATLATGAATLYLYIRRTQPRDVEAE